MQNVMSFLHILLSSMKSGASPKYISSPFPALPAQKQQKSNASKGSVYY
jgi:hypothetical protein